MIEVLMLANRGRGVRPRSAPVSITLSRLVCSLAGRGRLAHPPERAGQSGMMLTLTWGIGMGFAPRMRSWVQ